MKPRRQAARHGYFPNRKEKVNPRYCGVQSQTSLIPTGDGPTGDGFEYGVPIDGFPGVLYRFTTEAAFGGNRDGHKLPYYLTVM